MSMRLVVPTFLLALICPLAALAQTETVPEPLPDQSQILQPDSSQPDSTQPVPPQPDPLADPLADPTLQPGAPIPADQAAPVAPPKPIYRVSPGVSPLDVLASLTQLLNQGANRAFFGLPGETNWRADDGIRIAVYSDQRDTVVPFLRAASERFSAATSMPIELVMARRLTAVAGAETAREATGANLEILFGPRALMGQFAAGVGMNRTVLTRFLEGRWSFGFVMPRQPRWIGRVFIAQEEPSEAVEAALVLALVWSLGGVTLGDELQGLVDPFSVEPTLTPLGQSVFSLMYHPDLEAGLPIAEALQRAQQLVQQGRITADQSLQ